ncbi:GxGYxYP domain-containing protein [Anseongella ginsenosidimutans]|nr:GxGYxYP domain-containing protein [Anseongella ginsenosidimutans]QEC53010.1 hypothetical protein FRZ59_12150 [Anseongella ginsenosidimutans]
MKNTTLLIRFSLGILLTCISISSISASGIFENPVSGGSNPRLPPIGLFDLGYTLKLDMSKPENVRRAWDEVHALATLQGIVNREKPLLYYFYIENEGINIDRYWWQWYRAAGRWLNGRDTLVHHSLEEVVTAYLPYIKGAVIYDPKVAATSNVASSLAGAEDIIAVRYDTTEGSLYRRIILEGPRVPVKIWLLHENDQSLFTGRGTIPGTSLPSTGSAKNDAYRWYLEHYMKAGRFNSRYGAYYIDQQWMKKPTATRLNHHTLSNHDFFVSRRGFFFDLSPWGDEPATDEPGQKPGTDLETLKRFLLTAYKKNDGKKMCYIGGFPPWAFKYTKHAGGGHDDVPTEWEYSRIISAYNAFKDADAIGYGALANASFWQHFPLKKHYRQEWVSKAELKERGYLDEKGKLQLNGRQFMIFYVGDYDAASWVSQTTPTIWDAPGRGTLPLMWCISPVLEERVPHALAYQRETASPNDYFAAADNGAGYLMPGMLQEPRPVSGLPGGLKAWGDHCIPYYKRWDLSITGFIIDGEAPGLNEQGLDQYARFSPNGIVPQKVPLTLLHGNMPVLRADYDVNQSDPGEAAHLILDRIDKRPVPFHWFRNILKKPGWYTQVMQEVKKLDPSVELLDAPTFFELYRIWLKESEEEPAGD